uniref:Paired amphipathic helix protein Sin3-like 2 isoform X1 n=1 Tax=Tanacetum cinerariifolium TaxID=118510 RepID=A0A6L2P4I3_TANCI|nr:paired amphipathic helix protein Sin3-like 2 isoform X1 [Tanacetum cinerariifolium]
MSSIVVVYFIRICTSDGHEAKSNIDDISSSQQGDTSRTPHVANGNFAKLEKEKGELSPNVYFYEADLAAYGDHNGSNSKAKHSMEIDADADDEDNKNVSKGGDDVSGCESTADECSREDHEDRNRDDLDGKAENEGEAEGIEDTKFIGADGTYSDHILISAKPLAKRVASPLHDGGKKDCNVFYGNESFYALFRLHQVLYNRILSAKFNSKSAESTLVLLLENKCCLCTAP